MQRYLDLPRLRRLRRAARILSFGGLGVLVIALLLSLGTTANMGLTLGLALLGLVTSQMGSILMRRWPDRGRPDQIFAAALKGLDHRNALFHYLLGSRHTLLTPGGPVSLVPVYEPGQFALRDGSVWRTKTKRGAPSGKPRPAPYILAEAEEQSAALARDLGRRLSIDPPEVASILVFVHPEARVEGSSDRLHGVHVKKLKEYVRSLPRRSPFSPEAIASLTSAFARVRVEE
jgi:hypothetical protein